MPALGAVELQAVRGAQVQKLYNSMTRARLSEKTVKNVSAVLHKAFSVALKQRIITANPCDAAGLPKAEHREIRPLADGEIPQFLAAIDGSPMRNACALCLFAGLREGECLGLPWKQVDFEKGRITVSQQLQREKVKGGKYYIFCKRFKAVAASIGGPHDFVYTFANSRPAQQCRRKDGVQYAGALQRGVHAGHPHLCDCSDAAGRGGQMGRVG